MSSIPSLLMLGDSLVEWGDWPELLPGLEVINRGIAGEHVEELAVRIGEELARNSIPDYILIMAGTNNLLMGNVFFPAILRSMLPRIATLCPKATITVNAIMPMTLPGLETQVTRTNIELETVALKSGCRFLDMTIPFQEHCLPITRPCFMTDGVHLSTLGYQVWAREIQNHFSGLC